MDFRTEPLKQKLFRLTKRVDQDQDDHFSIAESWDSIEQFVEQSPKILDFSIFQHWFWLFKLTR